jgi:hypothetical protein
MITLKDRNAESGSGGYTRGANTLDEPPRLGQGECLLLNNAVPGDPPTPRNAIVDIFTETTARGYGSEHTSYLPGSVHITAPDGDEFLFAWSRDVTSTKVLNLELLNITDSTRSVLMSIEFATATAHVSMLKLYNSVYCLFDDTVTVNRTHPYLTRNVVIYWTGSAWAARAWGISVDPSIGAISTQNAGTANFGIYVSSTQVVYFNGYLWLIGGYNGSSTYSQKVFKSLNGINWSEVGTNTLPFAMGFHSVVVFHGKMWIVGGSGAAAYRSNKVYSSSDGITWTASNDFPTTITQHTCLVFNDKMWVICGWAGGAQSRKVYSSSDGITWTEAGTNSFPTATSDHNSVVFGGKMWVLGGYGAYYKTHYSSDGIIWTEACAHMPVEMGSTLSTTVVYNGLMWVFGGSTEAAIDKKKVYYSSDGITWTEAGSSTFPAANNSLSSIVFNNVIWAIGGTTFANKIYITSDGITWTQQVGGISKDKYVSVSTTFVRRSTNIGSDCAIYEVPIDESAENTSLRQTIKMLCSTSTGTLLIPMPDPTSAVAQGATHMRVWRTLQADSEGVAAGLSHRFLVDISLTAVGFSQATTYQDITSDSILSYESNAIDTTGYEISPKGRFATWDQERIWISAGGGYWLYSIGASQDVEFPQKYASFFQSYTQRILFDPDDGQRDTGAKIFQGDLYFFKDQKVGVLDGANPNNTPRVLSSGIGCDFPQSLTPIDHPKLGKIILFLSGREPAFLGSGGTVQALEPMRLTELWNDGLFHVDPSTKLGRSNEWKEAVSAAWFKNAWRVVLPGQTVPKIYGFYASADGKHIGAFTETPATAADGSYPLDPAALIVKDGNTCYCISNKSNIYRTSNYLKNSVYQDKYASTDRSYSVAVKSRAFTLDADASVMGELSDIHANCTIKDAGLLTMTAYTERFSIPVPYIENIDTGLATLSYPIIRNVVHGILLEGLYGRYFYAGLEKVVPSDGSFVFRGFEIHIIPRPEFGPEFFDGSSARANGW